MASTKGEFRLDDREGSFVIVSSMKRTTQKTDGKGFDAEIEVFFADRWIHRKT
jgi:hypothetical protein